MIATHQKEALGMNRSGSSRFGAALGLALVVLWAPTAAAQTAETAAAGQQLSAQIVDDAFSPATLSVAAADPHWST